MEQRGRCSARREERYVYIRNELLGVKREMFFVVDGRARGWTKLCCGGIRHGHTGSPLVFISWAPSCEAFWKGFFYGGYCRPGLASLAAAGVPWPRSLNPLHVYCWWIVTEIREEKLALQLIAGGHGKGRWRGEPSCGSQYEDSLACAVSGVAGHYSMLLLSSHCCGASFLGIKRKD